MALRRAQSGLTLIELMIVIVIVGVLAAIGYPSYLEQVRRANRADAREALTIIANEQERFFTSTGSFTTDLGNFSMPTADGVTTSKSGFYTITVAAGNTGSIATSYTLTATPVAGLAQEDDSACPSLSVDSAGSYLPDPAVSDCW